LWPESESSVSERVSSPAFSAVWVTLAIFATISSMLAELSSTKLAWVATSLVIVWMDSVIFSITFRLLDTDELCASTHSFTLVFAELNESSDSSAFSASCLRPCDDSITELDRCFTEPITSWNEPRTPLNSDVNTPISSLNPIAARAVRFELPSFNSFMRSERISSWPTRNFTVQTVARAAQASNPTVSMPRWLNTRVSAFL